MRYCSWDSPLLGLCILIMIVDVAEAGTLIAKGKK